MCLLVKKAEQAAFMLSISKKMNAHFAFTTDLCCILSNYKWITECITTKYI